jgi:hypothetical protein
VRDADEHQQAEGRDIYGDIERAEDAASDHAAIFVNINA